MVKVGLLEGLASGGSAPSVEQDADEALMAAFCRGSEAAFNLLFERYAGPIRALVTRLTGNPTLATDVTQATFLSLVRARGRFVPGARLKPWLYAIAMNAMKDQRRRDKREDLSEDGSLPDAGYTHAHRDHGLLREVELALSSLPENQREAIVLHHVEGFSFKEIAEMIGASESAVKVRAHRGYEHLREQLKETWVHHE